MSREIRFLYVTELRAVGDGHETPMALEGYAAKFNSESKDLGGFTEFVRPGAFKRTLAAGADVRCLMNHDPNKILGRTKSKTLQLREDTVGLWFHTDLPNTTIARDLHTSVSRGDIDQCSFAFSVEKDGQEWKEEKAATGEWVIKRYLNDVDLADVSAVTYPAYEDTVVNARSAADLVPMEVRSRIEARKAEEIAAALAATEEAAKVAAAGEAARSEAAPATEDGKQAETRPYSKPSDAPDHVPADKKAQWVEVFNSVFDKAKKAGKSTDEADKEAFTQANGVAKRDDEEAPVKDNRGMTGDTSYSALSNMLCAALCEKYGCDTNGFTKYWMQEVFDDYIIACNSEDGRLCKIPYTTSDPDNDNDVDAVELGEPAWVDLVYVPETEENSLKSKPGKFTAAHRSYMHDMGYGPDENDDEDENDDRMEKCSMSTGDCEDAECPCQNQMVDMPDDFSDEDRTARAAGEKTRTKKVAGKNLSAKSFAFVGDVNDTTTWKLPVMDENHARNALARFNQTQGIPEDKKAGVLAKIHAACHKFGIQVSEEKSADRSEELARQIRLLTARVQMIDPTFRGVPDQPRQDGGKFDSGPNHLASAADHVSRMNAHDAEARVGYAYMHARAAVAHYEAAVNPSSDASAKAKDASARCMGM